MAVLHPGHQRPELRALGNARDKVERGVALSIGSSAAPTISIWKKWSITQMLAKPASSAVRAILTSPGPMEPGAPGHVNLGTCNPTRTPAPSVPSGSIPSAARP